MHFRLTKLMCVVCLWQAVWSDEWQLLRNNKLKSRSLKIDVIFGILVWSQETEADRERKRKKTNGRLAGRNAQNNVAGILKTRNAFRLRHESIRKITRIIEKIWSGAKRRKCNTFWYCINARTCVRHYDVRWSTMQDDRITFSTLKKTVCSLGERRQRRWWWWLDDGALGPHVCSSFHSNSIRPCASGKNLMLCNMQ